MQIKNLNISIPIKDIESEKFIIDIIMCLNEDFPTTDDSLKTLNKALSHSNKFK